MAAETSWHRYCTNLRHCLPVYRVWVKFEGGMMCVIVVFRGEQVAGGGRGPDGSNVIYSTVVRISYWYGD